MGKIITVASGKGGTGKTTTVAAVSSCLAALGHKTLCIDFDTGTSNLDLALGMTDFTVMDYTDVMSGQVDVNDACSESPFINNLFFLSAPTSGELREIDRGSIMVMFEMIRETFDYCFIDAPSGIGDGFKVANNGVDMSIIVTTGELPAMRDAMRAIGTLRDKGLENIRLLANKVNPGNLKRIKTTIDDIIDTTGARLIGIIPEDRNVFLALHEATPLVLYYKRKSAYGFLDVALRVTGKDVPLRQY